METKCKNCVRFSEMLNCGCGSKGCCVNGSLPIVHDREDACDCGAYIEMPKIQKIRKRIAYRLKPWVRERDAMFVRAMEIVGHISELFHQGEFKVFDAVKSITSMKHIVFHGAATELNIDQVWTYHCPWNEDIEQFIAITKDGKMMINTYDDVAPSKRFVTETYDIETEFDTCDDIIDRIHRNCVMKVNVSNLSVEVENNKCVSEEINHSNTVCW